MDHFRYVSSPNHSSVEFPLRVIDRWWSQQEPPDPARSAAQPTDLMHRFVQFIMVAGWCECNKAGLPGMRRQNRYVPGPAQSGQALLETLPGARSSLICRQVLLTPQDLSDKPELVRSRTCCSPTHCTIDSSLCITLFKTVVRLPVWPDGEVVCAAVSSALPHSLSCTTWRLPADIQLGGDGQTRQQSAGCSVSPGECRARRGSGRRSGRSSGGAGRADQGPDCGGSRLC